MSTTQNTSKSIVASVASHEQELLAKLEASTEEAREIVDQARANARTSQQNSESKLNDDMAEIRCEKDEVREAQLQATVSAAEERLADVRTNAASQVDAIAQEVLSLFIPKGGN
ncbi:MAG: V-type ATPase subunit subunit G family protein [Candidatus Hydrogenedentota bacterium]